MLDVLLDIIRCDRWFIIDSRIHSLFENDEVPNLNEEECKMLQNLISLYLQMSNFEERKIFFLGARENYFYFKNMNLIKE